MEQLIEEYRQTAKKLLQKRKELEMQLRTARGEKAFFLERRIDCLNGMYLDTSFAIREMIKSTQKGEKVPCREVDRHQVS